MAETQTAKAPEAGEFKEFTRRNGKVARIRIKPKEAAAEPTPAKASEAPAAKSSGSAWPWLVGAACGVVIVAGVVVVARSASRGQVQQQRA